MFYASWLGVDNGPPPDEISSDMLLLSEAAGISSEELPPKMPMFSVLGSQAVDCIPPESVMHTSILLICVGRISIAHRRSHQLL